MFFPHVCFQWFFFSRNIVFLANLELRCAFRLLIPPVPTWTSVLQSWQHILLSAVNWLLLLQSARKHEFNLIISTNVSSMLYKSLPFIYHLHFTSSRDANEFKRFSCSLQHQYSNYSNSNTSRTPVEPSKVPLGTSTTTSAIKIGEVTFFFSAFGRTTPLPTLGAGSSFRHPLD